MIIIIVIINGILIGMASVSVIQSVKRQLRAENSQTQVSEITQTDDVEIEQQDDVSTETNLDDNMNLDFGSIIQYVKDGRLGIFLAGLKILIGVNLIIVSVLIFLKLKR